MHFIKCFVYSLLMELSPPCSRRAAASSGPGVLAPEMEAPGPTFQHCGPMYFMLKQGAGYTEVVVYRANCSINSQY